ncbi:MAG: hypothetical protein IPP56_16770 [Bacteroidetes bacterium]|nr:hypothetical protein [Bacteroidota bacterium]
MKKSDIYEIAIKILGLYLFFISIGLLRETLTTYTVMLKSNQTPDSFGNFDQTPFFILTLANFVLQIIFASILTFKTKTLAKLICKPTDYNETASLFVDRKVIYEIALVIVGLLTIIWTLPDFAFKLKGHIQLVQSNLQTKNNDTNFIITSTIKLIVGLIAIIYARPISKSLAKNDRTGQPE